MTDSYTTEYRWSTFIAALDPVQGSEQAGTRPVLVVSGEDFNQRWEQVAILPITTRKAGRRVFPGEALLPAGTAGLEKESLVLAHQIRAISKNRLQRHLGKLPPELQDQVRKALRLFLEL
ncbi:MAG: type II toxin-antitoxin system PemK/MazF family toxin [Coprothermobacterota bacterium]|nr:type II toxin-antitoxin system PemK/MazF family toxin [Coprothermobacterota bacterium]